MLVLESQTPSKSVTYVSGLNCYLCARLDKMAAFLSVLTNPDRKGGDAAEGRKTYFSSGHSTDME